MDEYERPFAGASASDRFVERYGDVAPDGNRRAARSMDVSSALEKVIDGLRSSGSASVTYRAMRLWRRMSDRRVRDHTHAVYLDRNRKQPELIVYVDHSVWLYEFRMLREAILAEWNALCADDPDLVAASVSFKLSSRARDGGQNGSVFSTREPALSTPADFRLPELDDGEKVRLDEEVSAITDDSLRQTARNAIEMCLRRKKADLP